MFRTRDPSVGYGETDGVDTGGPQALSAMAVGSLGLALLSLLGCVLPLVAASLSGASLAMAVFITPAFGLIAAVMALLALRAIGRAGGQLGGRPAALAGLFLGLLSAVSQGSLVLGATRTIYSVRNTLVPVMETMIADLGAGDMDGVRALLAPATSAALDDGQLAEFDRLLREHCGTFQNAQLDVRGVLAMAGELRKASQSTTMAPTFDARPVQLVFDRGIALTYVMVDQDAISKGAVLIEDVFVLSPDQSAAIALLPDGPGKELGLMMRRTALTPEAAGGGPAEAAPGPGVNP